MTILGAHLDTRSQGREYVAGSLPDLADQLPGFRSPPNAKSQDAGAVLRVRLTAILIGPLSPPVSPPEQPGHGYGEGREDRKIYKELLPAVGVHGCRHSHAQR